MRYDLNDLKVLIVDDDPFMGEVYESLVTEISEIGAEYFSSGYEAISYLKSEPALLVITDYYMPNGDGGMLSHYCHDHNIPCVVLSSHPSEELRPYLPKDTIVLEKIAVARGQQLEDIVKSVVARHVGRREAS